MADLQDLLKDMINYDSDDGSCIYDPEEIAECIKDFMEDSEEQSIEDARISEVVVSANPETDQVQVCARMDAIVDDYKRSLNLVYWIQY